MSPGRKKAPGPSSPLAAGVGQEKGNRKAEGRKMDPKSEKPRSSTQGQSTASKQTSTIVTTSESRELTPKQLLKEYRKCQQSFSPELKLFFSRLTAYGICRACMASFQLSAMKRENLEHLCVSNFFKFINGITDATRFVECGKKVINLVELLKCSVCPKLDELKIMREASRIYFAHPAQIQRGCMSKKFINTYKRQVVNFFVSEYRNLKSGENITDAIIRGCREVWLETKNHSNKRHNAYQVRWHGGEGQRQMNKLADAPADEDLISDAKICESALMFSIFPNNTIWCPSAPAPKKKDVLCENYDAEEVGSVQSENETLTARLKKKNILKNRNQQRRETLEAEGKGLFKKDSFEERQLKVAKTQAKAIGKQAKAMDLDSKLGFLKFAHEMGMTKDEIKPLIRKTIKKSFESSQSVESISDSDGSEVKILDEVVSNLSNDEPVDSNNCNDDDGLDEDVLFDDPEAEPSHDDNEEVYTSNFASRFATSPSRLSKNQLNDLQKNSHTSHPASANLKTSAMKNGENRPTLHQGSATLKSSSMKMKTTVTPDGKTAYPSKSVRSIKNPYKKSKQSGGGLQNNASLKGNQSDHDLKVKSTSNSVLAFPQSHIQHANQTSQESMDESMERFMSSVPLPSQPLKQPSHVARSDSKKPQNDTLLNRLTFEENQRRIAMGSAGWKVHKSNLPIDLVDVEDNNNDAVDMSQVTFRGNEDYEDEKDLPSVNSEEYDGRLYEDILPESQCPVELSKVEFCSTKRLNQFKREGKERPGLHGYSIIETCGAFEQCKHKFMRVPVIKDLYICSKCRLSMHSDCCLDHPKKNGQFLCPSCNSG